MSCARYLSVFADIQPFDCIAFSSATVMGDLVKLGEEYLNLTKTGTPSKIFFTHVGLVVTAESLPGYNLLPGRLYIFESTTSVTPLGKSVVPPDVLTKRGWTGVQLRDLEQVLISYTADRKSKVAWCKLKYNPWLQLVHRDELIVHFKDFFREYHHRLYEYSVVTMLATVCPELRKPREIRHQVIARMDMLRKKLKLPDLLDPNQWQFCSELCARVYQLIGVLSADVVPENIVPEDFFADNGGEVANLFADPVYLSI